MAYENLDPAMALSPFLLLFTFNFEWLFKFYYISKPTQDFCLSLIVSQTFLHFRMLHLASSSYILKIIDTFPLHYITSFQKFSFTFFSLHRSYSHSQVNFTDLVKFETFDRDQDYILDKSGIKDLVKVETKVAAGAIPRSSADFVQGYVDEVSQELLDKIVNLYLVDFLIFDYPLPVKN